jgi:hypothetical protein
MRMEPGVPGWIARIRVSGTMAARPSARKAASLRKPYIQSTLHRPSRSSSA